MTKMLRRGATPWWSVLAVAATVLVGCGGSGDSPGPDPVTFPVTVSVSGSGKVTSPSGIDCGTTCSTNVPTNTSITLTAAPAPGQVLQGWGGACAGATGATCTVTVSQATTASATFVAQSFPLSVAVTGNGSVGSQPAGINCGSTCSANFAASTAVVLTATPAQGQVLQAWGGACASATGATCTVTLTQAASVTATFAAQTSSFALTVAVTGNGSVSSQPAGISCGTTCSANFASPTVVTLTAAPAQGQVLQAWGGACTGAAATCTVTMSAARSVTATFVADSGPALAWGTAALLENSNDFNVAGTNIFADVNVLSAIDASGNGLVIWQQSDGTPDGGTSKVWSRRYVAGTGWAAAVAIPGLLASSSVNLVTGRLVIDAAGVATWVRHTGETRRYTAAGGWATAFAPATTVGEVIDARLDGAGNLYVLAYGGGEVHYNRLPVGASQWAAWVDVSQSNLNASPRAQLAVRPGGEVIVVWRERNAGDNNYSMKANRTVGGVWQAPVRIEELFTNVNDSALRLATDANGNAIAAWHQASSVYVSRFDAATGTWGTPVEVDAGQVGTTFSSRIQLAMAANGRAVLAWNSTFALKAMSYAPGTGWSAPAVVNSYNAGYFVGIDADGRAVAVYRSVSQWPNPTDATQNVYARELPAGGATWSAAALLETGAGDVKDTVLCAMNASGQTMCAWVQDDLPNDQIRNSLWAAVRR